LRADFGVVGNIEARGVEKKKIAVVNSNIKLAHFLKYLTKTATLITHALST